MKTFKVTCLFLFLSLLSMLGYFSSDTYLPAFENMRLFFNTTKSVIGISLSLYVLGFAIGQLFYGSLSDIYGRKKVLVFGLLLYLFGTYLAMTSNNITLFLIARVIQALGACAPAVIWQALVIDQFKDHSLQVVYGVLFALLGISPALSPTIGGFLVTHYNWQSVFLFLFIYAVILLMLTFLILKNNTNKQAIAQNVTATNGNSHNTRKQSLLNNYQTLFTSNKFILYTMIICCSSSVYFCYLTASPFILHNLGYSAKNIGFSYIPQALLYMAGSVLSKKLQTRYGIKPILVISIYIGILSTSWLVIRSFFITNPLEFIGIFLITAFVDGVIYPCAISLSYAVHRDIAGSAVGVSGFLQAVVIFITTGIVSALANYGMISLSIIMFILYIFVYLIFRIAQKNI